MVNKLELRPGNLLKRHNSFFIIDDILNVTLLMSSVGNRSRLIDTIDRMEPVQITEDLLIRIGFKVLTRCADLTIEFTQPETWVHLSLKDGKAHLIDEEGLPINNVGITSLHWLQNLVFFICGEELKINFMRPSNVYGKTSD